MTETIFTAQNLTKKYKQFCALNQVNMEIKRGDIYGFVGENGAGKTTLIRILTGLSRQTEGGITLFGASDPEDLLVQRKRISAIVESPVLYPDMTAVENMEICRLQRRISCRYCIPDLLQVVHLTDTGKKKVKHFSLGMKQRLGVAMSLLSNPEFLVLDEPVNGLDPAGIIEFREFLKSLSRDSHITILISSHILSELHHLATHYGFIHKGSIIEQISAKDLNQKCKKHLVIQVDDGPKAAVILETVLKAPKFDLLPNHLIRLYDFPGSSGEVGNALYAGGITISELSTKGEDLEDYYMSLIGGQK